MESRTYLPTRGCTTYCALAFTRAWLQAPKPTACTVQGSLLCINTQIPHAPHASQGQPFLSHTNPPTCQPKPNCPSMASHMHPALAAAAAFARCPHLREGRPAHLPRPAFPNPSPYILHIHIHSPIIIVNKGGQTSHPWARTLPSQPQYLAHTCT